MNILFKNKTEWEAWLSNHYAFDEGITLIFDKSKVTSSLTSEEALDVALRYGWIDGLINKIDNQFYQKYFKKRAKLSIWSTKNKNRVNELMNQGIMMPSGIEAVSIAKQNGRWDQGDSLPADFDFTAFKALLRLRDILGYEQFLKFSPSVQKTYAISYYGLKKSETREKRLEIIIERSKKGLKPMD